jgi:succinyl-CoA synthetase beta subunit
MPIEIREIIIKTQVVSGDRGRPAGVREKDLNLVKRQLIEECKRMIRENTERSNYKR